MTVQVIPSKITGPVLTELTYSTAAAHQDLMAFNVKQIFLVRVRISFVFVALIYRPIFAPYSSKAYVVSLTSCTLCDCGSRSSKKSNSSKEVVREPLDDTNPVKRCPGARFSKAPETFRARKAIAKSRTLRVQSSFLHVF